MGLISSDLDKVWRKFMAVGHSPPTILKADVRAAIAALDGWLDTNAASLNTSFPANFRTAATVQQKALVVAYIALQRAGVV